MQPLNQMCERVDRGRQLGIESIFGKAVADLVGDDQWHAIMPFRLGYPTVEALLSPPWVGQGDWINCWYCDIYVAIDKREINLALQQGNIMKNLLKLEELFMFALSIFLFSKLDFAWWWYPVLLFTPDLSRVFTVQKRLRLS